jgi:hypothetical protein
MKHLAYILSIIIVVLTVMPCIDEPGDNVLQNKEITHGSANHQDEPDHCSPFCTCQCCQANFFISEYIASTTPISVGILHYEVAPNILSIELFDYFIPPKV